MARKRGGNQGLKEWTGGGGIRGGRVCRVFLGAGPRAYAGPGPDAPFLAEQNFTASGEAEARRCARREELLARGCPLEELEEPRGQQEVLQDQPLSQGARGEGATQLAPQRVRVTLRPGELGEAGPAQRSRLAFQCALLTRPPPTR